MSGLLHDWTPPEYRPMATLAGRSFSGHAHTVLPVAGARMAQRQLDRTTRHLVDLPDGDALVLHRDESTRDRPRIGTVVLVHGLCGCHAAGYMMRFAARLNAIGVTTFRLDMRGCGSSAATSRHITHAGRSDDVMAAMQAIAGGGLDDGAGASPLGMVSVSLGGNQTLRMLGRVGAGLDSEPTWWPRLCGVIAIAPPIDLQTCSDTMESRHLRFYNRYFIRHLLQRIPAGVSRDPVFQAAMDQPRPRTLRQFDRRFTAPLAGFESEAAYYDDSSAMHWLASIERPTLILATGDDPLVPLSMFTSRLHRMSPTTRLLSPRYGGHNGFLQRGRRAWTDDMVPSYFQAMFSKSFLQ